MAQIKRNARVVNTRVDAQKHQDLSVDLIAWGYKYQVKGNPAPWWGAFIEAIADGAIADDGENIIFKIPYKKG